MGSVLDPQSTNKYLNMDAKIVCFALLAVFAMAAAESDPESYYGGHYGYGRGYGGYGYPSRYYGYGYRHYGKRSAEPVAEADADAEAYGYYGRGYGYGGYGRGYGYGGY